MIPIPSLGQLKEIYDGVMKAVGFIKEEFSEKSHSSSDVIFYRPGRNEIVEKILNGKFPCIPGIYKVEINEEERFIEVASQTEEDMAVTWKFRDKGEAKWWALPKNDIATVKWIELVEINYN